MNNLTYYWMWCHGLKPEIKGMSNGGICLVFNGEPANAKRKWRWVGEVDMFIRRLRHG